MPKTTHHEPPLASIDGIAQTLLGTDRLQACTAEQRRRWVRLLGIVLLGCSLLACVVLFVRAESVAEVFLLVVLIAWIVSCVLCLALLFAGGRTCPEDEEREQQQPLKCASPEAVVDSHDNCESAI